ncbi:hypothetical protein Q4106_17600 [Acinetobacter baumannii]
MSHFKFYSAKHQRCTVQRCRLNIFHEFVHFKIAATMSQQLHIEINNVVMTMTVWSVNL